MIPTQNLGQLGSLFAPTDPFFSSVELLLDMETDVAGGTVFTDRSLRKRVVTPNNPLYGITQVSAEQAKFSSRAYKGANSHTKVNHVSTPDDATLRFATGDFTLEFWIRFTSVTTIGGLFYILQKAVSSDPAPWGFVLVSASGKLQFFGCKDAPFGSLAYQIESLAALVTNTWYHIAGTRSGNTFTLWIDGVSQGTATYAGSLHSDAAHVVIGGADYALDVSVEGYIDDVRFTGGVARYTANFSPPNKPHPLR
jgi:hypothetical protein